MIPALCLGRLTCNLTKASNPNERIDDSRIIGFDGRSIGTLIIDVSLNNYGPMECAASCTFGCWSSCSIICQMIQKRWYNASL